MSRISLPAIAAGCLIASTAAAQQMYIDIPDAGSLPWIFPDSDSAAAQAEQMRNADLRRHERAIRQVRAQHFSYHRNEELRAEGIEKLRQFTDPIAFQSMIELLQNEQEDVHYGLTQHFRGQENPSGDAALAWMAIRHRKQEAREMAEEALIDRIDALDGDVPDPVLNVVESHLRSNVHAHAGGGARLAQSLQLHQLVPTLIVSQVAQQQTGGGGQGDIAYIAVATEFAFVSDLTPVVGDNAVGFDPTISMVGEGVVLRIRDAVVQVYRYDVHNALVGMTSNDWGDSTEYLGFDVGAWRDWYRSEYRPYKIEQAGQEERMRREREQQLDTPATGG